MNLIKENATLQPCCPARSCAGRRAAVPPAAAAGPHNFSPATRFSSLQLPSTLWPAQLRRPNDHRLRLIVRKAAPVQPSAAAAAAADFAPHVDNGVLGAQLVVLAVTAGAAAYWWWAVVPSARRTLAKEKRAGPLNDYLLELQANPDKKVERWFYTDWLLQLQKRQKLAAKAAAKRQAAAGTSVTAVTDTSNATASRSAEQDMAAPQQKLAADASQADVEDKEPSFWSLDNPIVATGALLAAAALVSTLLHGVQR